MRPTDHPIYKSATAIPLALLGLAGMLASPLAGAAPVSGTATISINNTAFSASTINPALGYPNGWYVEKHWGFSDNQLGITGSTVGGTTLPLTGTTAMAFPVNTNTTTVSYPAAGPYGRTVQATTMDATNTADPGKQIGLSGAWRLASQGTTGMLAPYDFRLLKTAGTWTIQTYDTGFSFQDFLKLTNVVETSNVQGQLLLKGDLVWAGAWASFLGANASTVVGTFNLTPTATTVPALPLPALWLLGAALVLASQMATQKPATQRATRIRSQR